MEVATPSQLVTAVNALYRVRAVERVSDADGLREVWHQCAQGADLLSFVTSEGRVLRQELTLLGDYFLWTSRRGLLTGAISRSARPTASPHLHIDTALVPDRIHRGSDALRGYVGTDQYLLHIRDVLVRAAEGLQWHGERTLTHPGQEDVVPSPPLRGVPWWFLVAIGGCLAAFGLTWVLWG